MSLIPRFAPRLNPGSVTANNRDNEVTLENRVGSLLVQLEHEYPQINSSATNIKDKWANFVAMEKTAELLEDPRVKYIEFVSRPEVDLKNKLELDVPRTNTLETWKLPNNMNSSNVSRPGSPNKLAGGRRRSRHRKYRRGTRRASKHRRR